MRIETLSSREFKQDVSKVRKAAERRPVIITNRGRPSHVPLTLEEYKRITGRAGPDRRSAGDAGHRGCRVRDRAGSRSENWLYSLTEQAVDRLRL
jgi:prevent-host-death family protein